MKSLSTYTVVLLSVFSVIIIIGCVTLYSVQRSEIENKIHQDTYAEMVGSLQQQLEKKVDIGITNSISFASSGEIIRMVQAGDREGLLAYTSKISKIFKESSNFKNIKLQFFSPDMNTLVRSWKKDAYGDVSPPVRQLLSEVKREQRALSAFVLDNDGLLLRGTSIIGSPDNPVGYIQYIQGVGSISRDYAKEGRFFVLLIKTSNARQYPAIKNNKTLAGYTLANNKWFSDKILTRLENIDFAKVAKEKFFISDGLFIIVAPVVGQQGQDLGTFILAEPAEHVQSKFEAAMKASQYFMVAMILGFVIIFALVFAVLRKKVLTPLAHIKQFAKKVSQGNWNAQPEGKYYFELAALKTSLLSMVGELEQVSETARQKSEEAVREAANSKRAADEAQKALDKAEKAKSEGIMFAVRQLRQIVDSITDDSEKLSDRIQNSNKDARDQYDRLKTSAAALEEMTATVMEVADNSMQSAESTNDAKLKANEGNDVVHSAVEAIDQVHSIANALKVDMDHLGEQASGIGQIVNVISDIADQTNLLALNAAIEAARAGDAGRGFAVVADEVRKLAEKTQSATKQVEDSVHAIQTSTEKNVGNVENAVETIQSANTLATKSGKVLEEIVKLVENASEQVRTIANASELQSQTSEEINQSIEYVSRISDETVNSMDEASQAVIHLAEQTAMLRQLICDLEDGCEKY